MKRIAPVLLGCDALVQAKLDAKVSGFDGTPNKRKLGVNALLGVSLGSAHVDLAVFSPCGWRRFFDFRRIAPRVVCDGGTETLPSSMLYPSQKSTATRSLPFMRWLDGFKLFRTFASRLR